MITLPLDPIIAHIGPLALRWYSLIVLGAIAIGLFHIDFRIGLGRSDWTEQHCQRRDDYTIQRDFTRQGSRIARFAHYMDLQELSQSFVGLWCRGS